MSQEVKQLLDIKSMTPEEIKAELKTLGEPSYRAEQIFVWLQKGVSSFDEMTNLSKALREKLREHYYIATATIERRLDSQLDETKKYLFRLHDGEYVESVLMKYHHGYSICISSQVGCKMGCTFCATGLGGFCRNLTASELLSQIHAAQIDNNIRISNVVLMGMGEPLDNYDQVLRFLRLVSEEKGLNIGMRHITSLHIKLGNAMNCSVSAMMVNHREQQASRCWKCYGERSFVMWLLWSPDILVAHCWALEGLCVLIPRLPRQVLRIA